MALARTRRERGVDYWPGFVDALSTLILGIVFLLSVFVVVQFFLSQEVAGKETALSRLTAQINQLTDLLAMEKTGKVDLESEIARLRASLSGAMSERDRLKAQAEGSGAGIASAEAKLSEAARALANEKSVTSKALTEIELLNQQIGALRRQLAAIEDALEASEKKGREAQARIADLGSRLNVALA